LKNADVENLRRKISLHAGIKVQALHLVTKGKQLIDNGEMIKGLKLFDNDKITVIVSQKTLWMGKQSLVTINHI